MSDWLSGQATKGGSRGDKGSKTSNFNLTDLSSAPDKTILLLFLYLEYHSFTLW